MTQPYPHEERKRSRELIKRLENYAVRTEEMARGKLPFDPKMVAGLAALTDTADLESQHRALLSMADQRRKIHMDHLVDLARSDLTAFAEVMSPHEPPAPHHLFVCERLMEIEGGDRDRLILSMPPGHAKDLDVKTPVMMGDGSWKKLGSIKVGDEVITHEGRPREVLAVHDQGTRPVLKIQTKSKRTIRAHPDHVFLTPFGWTPAKDLQIGIALAIPKEYEIHGDTTYSIDEFRLAGYMMARAVVTGRTYSRLYRITNKFRADDPAVLADFKAICDRMGFNYDQKKEESYGKEAITITLDRNFSSWLDEMGLWQVHKDDARIPWWVFTGTNERVASFLGALLSCDATFKPTQRKVRSDAVNQARLSQKALTLKIFHNHKLAWDMARLFQRMGIKAEVVNGGQFYNYKPVDIWRIKIADAVDMARVANRIPIIGSTRRFWELPLNVETFTSEKYHSDPIIAIEEDGETKTRCLTVEEDHSFLAEGIVVHNSTYGSRYYPAWYLGRKENRIYLQAGHGKDFSEKEFGRKTKDLILTDAYRRVFPDVTVRSDAKAAGDWILTNGNRYVAKGVKEGISGFRSTNNGIDDPYPTFADAQSPNYRQKVWDWFSNDFMTRLLPQGNAFVISTRWHMDDIIGRLIEMMEDPDSNLGHWDLINLPVFCTDPETDQMGRVLGEPLWPDFYTEQTLLRQKALMSPQQWAALYDGNPVPMEGNVIKVKWLTARYKTPPLTRANSVVGENWRNASGDPKDFAQEGPRDPGDFAPERRIFGGNSSPENLDSADLNAPPEKLTIIDQSPPYVRTVISVDSAEKETERADFSALTVWRETIDRRHYLVDAHHERMDFPKLLARVDQYAALWQAEVVLMEEKGAGNQFIQHKSAQSEPLPYALVPINPGKDGKVFRMDSVTPFFMANRVVLPERAPWLATFERELLQFPGGKHDDYADSVSQYLKWVRDAGTARRGTKKLR